MCEQPLFYDTDEGTLVKVPSFDRYKEYLNNLDRYKLLEIPCRKCESCKKNRTNEWVNRVSCQMVENRYIYMITLTFSPENLILEQDNNDDSFRKFIKKIRRYYQYHFGIKNLAYIAAREFGKNATKRKHYHVLFINFPKILDLKERIPRHYTSDFILKKWGLGHIDIIKATPQTVQYCLKYGLKAGKNEKNFFSKKIGFEYLQENYEKIISEKGYQIGERFFRPAKYFEKVLAQTDILAYFDFKIEKQNNWWKKEKKQKINKSNYQLKQELKSKGYSKK